MQFTLNIRNVELHIWLGRKKPGPQVFIADRDGFTADEVADLMQHVSR